VRAAVLAFAFALLATPQVFAQASPVCHLLCTPKLKVEPTVTFTNLFGSVSTFWTRLARGPSRLCSCYRSPLHKALFASATGRPNRSYRMGTTTMFRAVELNKPNMMTMAIGA
jgi:hypothetical protein